jgi:phosphodiesterase/alkaline phosphatase D-like protein
LHATASCLVTWDDHEVENDYANAWSQDVEVTPEAFLRRRAAAYQAYYEHMPLRARAVPTTGGMRLYDRFRFGNLMTFTVLDGRLFEGFKGSATAWNVLAQGQLVAQLRQRGAGRGGRPLDRGMGWLSRGTPAHA